MQYDTQDLDSHALAIRLEQDFAGKEGEMLTQISMFNIEK
jgi:hypothetical protein